MQVQSLGQEDTLEEEMATDSSILDWKKKNMDREPGRLQSLKSEMTSYKQISTVR